MNNIDKKKILKVLVRIFAWLAALFVLWFVLSLLGIFAVAGIMHATKGNPAYDLEMGWMAIILLVPVAAAIISLVITPFIMKLIFRKKNRNGKDVYKDEIK